MLNYYLINLLLITKVENLNLSKERYFRLKVRALFETKQYKACVECANQALATPLKWHYNALQWIKYYRGCALLELKEYDEANREFISLHNRIKGVNFYEFI